jgi:predicted AAA+ superfamily ATPase
MQDYVPRLIRQQAESDLAQFPVVALLGPRQCGKSTLSREIVQNLDAITLDLENPRDLKLLDEAMDFLEAQSDKLVVIDEVQRVPELFPILRVLADSGSRFLILGSASPELLRQSSESLAGRIAYLNLTPFLLAELTEPVVRPERFWLRGGFPLSYLAKDLETSRRWRGNFIATFLERDIPQFGIKVPALVLDRFWRMLAHLHGQVLNASILANAMDVSKPTVKHYIQILEQTYMVRLLPPYFSNMKKRLIKSPKLYIRDVGILNSLLDIGDMNDLFRHPVYGHSWEGLVIEQVISTFEKFRSSHYRTATGVEIDLILEFGDRRIAIECKASSSPDVGKGFYQALEDLEVTEAYVIAPVERNYPIKNGVQVCNLSWFLENFQG